MRTIRRIALVAGAGALALNTACYAYLPVSGQDLPAASQTVRVRLTPEGSTELARYIGPRAVEVEGTFSKKAGNGALIVVPDVVRKSDGSSEMWTGGGELAIPVAYVSSVRARTFNERRSRAVAVGAAITAVALFLVALKVVKDTKGQAPGGVLGAPPPSDGGGLVTY